MTSKTEEFSWPPHKALYDASQRAVLSFGSSSTMDSCNHEEEDTRMVVHVQHALKYCGIILLFGRVVSLHYLLLGKVIILSILLSNSLLPNTDPCRYQTGPPMGGLWSRLGWQPLWTTLPEASQSCYELIHCGCKKGCTNRCKCKKSALKCTALCSCSGDC